MFHVKDNLFFGRLPTGDVRILKFTRLGMLELGIGGVPQIDMRYPDHVVEFDTIIDSNVWYSIVASVSHSGETADRYYAAQQFHNE